MYPKTFNDLDNDRTMPYLLAGAAGGLAEVLWVMLYASATPLNGLTVAREVTVAVFGAPIGGSLAPTLGLAIHFLLSFALAAAFVRFIGQPAYRLAGKTGLFTSAIGVLAAIWAMNFFVVLPAIHPGFVALMPLAVTFISKTLFGLAMAGVLANSRRPDEDDLLAISMMGQ